MPTKVKNQSAPLQSVAELLDVMARLRDPNTGCPWDREQTFATIAPYTIEEAHEVAEAIAAGDRDALKDELGDLLFQVVFYAQMAAERGWFTFSEVAQGIADKMVRRHPHVFAGASVESVAAQTDAWEAFKNKERAERAVARGDQPSVLDGVPATLPALTRAAKLQKRAARVGFDWHAIEDIFVTLESEIRELRVEIAAGDPARIADELGDVLFSWVNLARYRDIDPEESLRGTNRKFERRFRRIEALLHEYGRTPQEASLAEMESLWQQAKHEERGAAPNPLAERPEGAER